MTLLKGLLLGSAASVALIARVPGARAADLPALQAAPIEYVRICDAYGAGFFFIPGTDTCLRIGGLVLGEFRGFNPSYSISGTGFYGNGIAPVHGAFAGVGIPAGLGYIPSVSQYTNARSRDATSFDALGRAELDSRTQSPYGTLRAFLRVDAYYGSGGNSATGSLPSLGNTFNTTAGSSSARYSTIVNKAFIQFAGLTAGYAQSMFDFYADAYNYNNLRGSNATVALLAYTATFGDGFSATLSAEDQASRRAAIGSTIAGTATAAGGMVPVTINGVTATSFQGSAGRVAGPGRRRQSPPRPALGRGAADGGRPSEQGEPLRGERAYHAAGNRGGFHARLCLPGRDQQQLWFRDPRRRQAERRFYCARRQALAAGRV